MADWKISKFLYWSCSYILIFLNLISKLACVLSVSKWKRRLGHQSLSQWNWSEINASNGIQVVGLSCTTASWETERETVQRKNCMTDATSTHFPTWIHHLPTCSYRIPQLCRLDGWECSRWEGSMLMVERKMPRVWTPIPTPLASVDLEISRNLQTSTQICSFPLCYIIQSL